MYLFKRVKQTDFGEIMGGMFNCFLNFPDFL